MLTAGVLLLLTPQLVFAHRGGEPRLVDVESGPFRISVWTLPVPLEAGELNFIVFVAQSSDQNELIRSTSPVLDANIELIIEPIDGGRPLVIRPDHLEATNKLFYESYFELLEPGEYSAVVTVESEGETGEVDFTFELERGLLEINWFRYAGLSLIAVVFGWFGWQVREERKYGEAD